MELVTYSIPKSTKQLVIGACGDFQWSGKNGPTAQDSLKRYIDEVLKLDGLFCGVGDYIDFLSPSNRRRLMQADLYDTAKEVLKEKALELVDEVFEKFLKPTVGRWIAMCSGHHFYRGLGIHSDEILCQKLKTKFVGTSAFVRIPVADLVLYLHHGNGGGVLPGSGLNKPYHVAAGLEGADIYIFGHDTKLVTSRLSRPYPVWGKKQSEHKLKHRDIWLVRCGGFSRSNVVGHRHGDLPEGDYAEQGNMTPSPLSAPIIKVDLEAEHDRIRVSI